MVNRYQLERIAYLIYFVTTVGGGKCTRTVICVLYRDSVNSSDCLMSNGWLMGEGLMGEGNIMAVLFRLTISQKVAFSIPDGVIGIFHLHNSFCRTMEQGSTNTTT
jgi:hypothetical protein